MNKGVKILVVEDSVITRHLVLYALRGMDAVDVVEASDGIDGLRKASETAFDIVIVDINMPLMDGFTLIERLRALDSYRHVPILVITVEGAPEDQKKALSLGANAYLIKPVKATEISQAIQTLVRGG